MVIVFDTDCVLCSRWTHFILRHEADRSIRFFSAWSEEGTKLAAAHGLAAQELDLTFLVINDAGLGLTHSDAGLAITQKLRSPWRWLTALRIIPRPVRNAAYRLVARNRYRWFGQSAYCFIPPQGDRDRFVDGSRLEPDA